MSSVLYKKDGSIARITLNLPDMINDINEESAIELEQSVK